mmetsp:Transcript_110209/g.329504  ORF Transcript_110209/g.329504 Transcript_110209/m.329504 type:complete len:230 (+) Transcript_110209:159-848(+)
MRRCMLAKSPSSLYKSIRQCRFGLDSLMWACLAVDLTHTRTRAHASQHACRQAGSQPKRTRAPLDPPSSAAHFAMRFLHAAASEELVCEDGEHRPDVVDHPSTPTLQPQTSSSLPPLAPRRWHSAASDALVWEVLEQRWLVVDQPWTPTVQPQASTPPETGDEEPERALESMPLLSPQVPPRYDRLSSSPAVTHRFRRKPSSTAFLQTLLAITSHRKTEPLIFFTARTE